MKHVIRPAALIVAAMVGSAIVLVLIIGVTKSLTVFSGTPADFLPTSQTDLVVHTPSADTLNRWKAVVSPPKSLLPENIHTIAHIRSDTELTGTVTFTKDAGQAGHSIGVYGIEVSDPLLLPLITTQANALGKGAVYQALQKRMRETLSWVYVSRSLLGTPDNMTVRTLRAALLGKASHFAYASNANHIVLAMHRPDRLWQTVSPAVPHASGKVLAWNYANGAQAWHNLRTTLSKNDAAIAEGLVRAFVAKLGTNVSFTHNILPLVEQPGTLQLTQTGGSLHILLSGSHPRTDALNTHLETLHSSYASTLPTTRITHRVLDQRFSSTDLRHDEEVIVQTEEQIGEFRVTGTRHADDADGLFTAVRGTDFLISTDKQVLLYALTGSAPLLQAEGSGTRTGELYLQPTTMAPLVKSVLPELSAMLEAMGTRPLFFFSEWKADVQSHTIRLPENATQLLDSLL